LGNQNNPPHIIIKNGDALEIKKIESLKSSIQLSSSPLKNKLFSTDKRITDDCKKCEVVGWKEKDLFYVFSYIKNKKIKYLFFVQGTCYAGDIDFYKNLTSESVIKKNNIILKSSVKLNKIKNPFLVFKDILKLNDKSNLQIFALMQKEKYQSYKPVRKNKYKLNSLNVEDVSIIDPENSNKFINATLISCSI
ncbi:MAG: NgoPII family restriction endonuclease, partial [Nanoarchaeota archaeon]